MRKYLTEFIGTFFLVFTVAAASVQHAALAPVAVALVLAALVYTGAHISGAHFNPAISLAMFVRREIGPRVLLCYLLVQFGAGLLAIFAVMTMFAGIADQPVFTLIAVGETGLRTQALGAEALLTFLLVLVFLHVMTARRLRGNPFYGLAVGFTFGAASLAAGPVSGGALNPALGLWPAVIELFKPGASVIPILVYTVGPLAGGLLAAFAFAAQIGRHAVPEDAELREGQDSDAGFRPAAAPAKAPAVA